jgi:undecaprenyl-diphosphatase
MSIVEAIVLGLVQGLTVFLPISSSGHLILVPWLLGWDEPGLAFDAALHLGTLLAVFFYFWRDLLAMLRAVPTALSRPISLLTGDPLADDADGTGICRERDARLALLLILGSIPGGIVGVLAQRRLEASFTTTPSAHSRSSSSWRSWWSSVSSSGGLTAPPFIAAASPASPCATPSSSAPPRHWL